MSECKNKNCFVDVFSLSHRCVAKVINMDDEYCLVHFINWADRFNRSFAWTSGSIRPLTKEMEEHMRGPTYDDGEIVIARWKSVPFVAMVVGQGCRGE